MNLVMFYIQMATYLRLRLFGMIVLILFSKDFM